MSATEQQAEAQPVVAETPEAAAPETTTEEKTNEPVEGGSVAAAAEDALLTNVTPTIFTALSFIAFVLFVIGTPLPWLRSDVSNRQQISLWSYEVETASGNQVTEVKDFGCDKMKEYFRGAEAFSIITIFVSAVTVLVGVLTRFRGTSAKPLGTVFAFLTALSSIICWGIGFAAYRRDFCGQPTFDQQRFYVYTGAALFVAGWVVSILALVISLKDIKVPKALPEAAVIKLVATLFTIVALAAFIFTVIATPVTTFSKWTSTTVENRVSIWHTYTYTNGVQTSKVSLHDSTCGDLKRYAGLAEAFHIITIFTTLVAVAAGGGALRGAGGLKGVIVAGLFATTTAIVATAADLAIFYKNFCSSQTTLDAQHYHRDAGFALIATTMVILAAATLLAISAAVLQLCSSKPEGGNVSKGSFLYIFGTIVSIVFLVVALTVPVLSREANGSNWAKIMWWETQTRAGTSFKQAAFQCQKVWQRLVGGGSIIIVAISFSTFGAILGVAQLSNGALTTAASAIGYFSAVLQLIAFSLAISAWRTTFCGVNFKDANFEYDIGFALVPASSCITAVVATLNLVFKA